MGPRLQGPGPVASAITGPVSGPAEAWREHAGPLQTVQDRFGDAPLNYRVSWSMLRLDPLLGAASAAVSATTYRLECSCDRAARPVMFFFNGGPGASSSPLHFFAGPRARGADGHFPDNPYTVLRAADLVFIDPVETGFSHGQTPDGAARYLGVEGDVAAVGRYIRAWLEASGHTEAPVLLAGQSYGGARLARLLPGLTGLDVRGLVLVSPALDAAPGASYLAHVISLPTMAATAWRFGRSGLAAHSEAESWELARAYAETDYLAALQQGDRIAPEAKAQAADTLAAMTGLDAGLIFDSNLRIETQVFLETLLAEDGLLISRLNTALTSPLPAPGASPGRPPAANDPALGLGDANMILAPEIGAYLSEMTGIALGADYRSLNLEANFVWDWRSTQKAAGGTPAPPALLAGFLETRPETRLIVFAGTRDLATPLLGTLHALSQVGLTGRAVVAALPGGHSPYDAPALRAAMADELFTFMTEAAGAAPAAFKEPAP